MAASSYSSRGRAPQKRRSSSYGERNRSDTRKKTGSRTGSARDDADQKQKKNVLEHIAEAFNESKLVAKDETQRMDQMMLWIIISLVVVGTLMMFSASYAYAYFNRGQDSAFFLKRQIAFALGGLVLMFLLSYVPPRYYRRFCTVGLAVSYVLLIIVYLAPEVNGAHRWIFGFQPSELTKFVTILCCASWADNNSSKMHTFRYGILPFAIYALTTGLLVLFEPHISCTIIILLLCVTIMAVGGMNLKVLLGAFVVALVGVACLILFRPGLEQISIFDRGYGRIDVWLDPFENPQGDGWQTIQALYAISSGGLFGQGIGNSHQKYLYISEPQNDFIFAVICEELGFVGAVAIILLFVIFVWRGFALSVSNSNRFCMLLGIGITAQVGWQALLNFMVVTNCAPNTGISLPFFSYGGSSLLVLLAEMGILLSVSRQSSIKKV